MNNEILAQTNALYTKPSKENVMALTDAIVSAVQANPESALLALAQLTGWAKAIKDATDNIRPTAVAQAKKAPTAKFEEYGVEYQLKKPSVRKNFAFYFNENGEQVNNEEWLAKKQQLDDLALELKGIETVLEGKKHYEADDLGELTLSVKLK